MNKTLQIAFLIIIVMQILSRSVQAQKSNLLPSGFYRVTATKDIKNAFLLRTQNTYYLPQAENYLPLGFIDSLYDESTYAYLTVNFVFKALHKQDLFSFTRLFQNQDVGLLVNGELLLVAHIVEPIANGSIAYSGSFDKAHVKHIETSVNFALKNEYRK